MNRTLLSVACLGALFVATGSRATEPLKSKSAEEILKDLGGGTRGATLKPGTAAPNPGGRKGATVDLQVQFEYNSAALTPQAVDQLQALAQALSDPALAPSQFRIEGHTDADGSAAYNMRLSNQRAASVKTFLVEHGIVATRLQARGYGESRPISNGITAEDKAQDRRVAVVNLGSAGGAPSVKQAPPDKTQPAVAVKPATEGAPPEKANVEVLVQYERDGQKVEVEEGTVLRPVDNYNVSFTPSKRSYVYIFQFDALGKAATVFPNKEHSASVNPVVANKMYVIPSDGRWLTVKDSPGDEIIVIASAEVVEDPRAVAQRVHQLSRGIQILPEKDSPLRIPRDLFSYKLKYKTTLP